jgi:hypothetical protein
MLKKLKGDKEIYSFFRSVRLNDPYWDRMWYLNRGEDLDMNVEGAWQEGVTGRGVAVTILDDGGKKNSKLYFVLCVSLPNLNPYHPLVRSFIP